MEFAEAEFQDRALSQNKSRDEAARAHIRIMCHTPQIHEEL